MNDAVKSAATKYGPIIGGISIAYTLIAYLIDLELMVNPWVGGILSILSFVLLIVSVAAAKKAMEGFISFKNAFATYILTFVISSLLATVFSMLLFTVIDPEAAESLQDMSIKSMVSLWEKLGVPESEIEKQVEEFEQNSQFSVFSQVKAFFMGIFFHAILGLIVAAVMKKDRPVFEYESLDGDNA